MGNVRGDRGGQHRVGFPDDGQRVGRERLRQGRRVAEVDDALFRVHDGGGFGERGMGLGVDQDALGAEVVPDALAVCFRSGLLRGGEPDGLPVDLRFRVLEIVVGVGLSIHQARRHGSRVLSRIREAGELRFRGDRDSRLRLRPCGGRVVRAELHDLGERLLEERAAALESEFGEDARGDRLERIPEALRRRSRVGRGVGHVGEEGLERAAGHRLGDELLHVAQAVEILALSLGGVDRLLP